MSAGPAAAEAAAAPRAGSGGRSTRSIRRAIRNHIRIAMAPNGSVDGDGVTWYCVEVSTHTHAAARLTPHDCGFTLHGPGVSVRCDVRVHTR